MQNAAGAFQWGSPASRGLSGHGQPAPSCRMASGGAEERCCVISRNVTCHLQSKVASNQSSPPPKECRCPIETIVAHMHVFE